MDGTVTSLTRHCVYEDGVEMSRLLVQQPGNQCHWLFKLRERDVYRCVAEGYSECNTTVG